jgi:serine/threonine-protein kinase
MIGEVYLGRYRAERLLGEGGMGRAYLGRQLDSGRDVVIKVMHDKVAADPRFRKNFQREMELMAGFRHPHAVELYDSSPGGNGRPCIVMEYIRGVTLERLIHKHRRLAPDRVGRLLGPLAVVIQAAHDAGVVHRDLTPLNIMVVDPDTPRETVKVMDFGLARMTAGIYIPLEKLQGTGQGLGGGTPDYISPEQVRGEEVDHRADLYSLGIVLFKGLTGTLPFEHAKTAEEIVRAQVEQRPPSFAEVGAATVPYAIETVVQQCLTKYPHERVQSATEVARRYEKALGRKILPEGPAAPASSALLPRVKIDPRSVVDCLEAWMPEPIAVVKLRGFANDLGGEVVDSEPGLVRFRLRDPSTPPPAPAAPSLLGVFGLSKKKPEPPTKHVLLELLLEKKQADQRNKLNITVMMKPEEDRNRYLDADFKDWCGRVARDLRAYLISR